MKNEGTAAYRQGQGEQGSKPGTRLLTEFGSMAKLHRAPLETIASVPGFSRILAQEIKDALG